jgi:histidinol phosphatase-like PHP family hydrolase
MTCPQYDFHIHTKYLGCANGTMEIPAIIQECERLGMTCVGITDHLNTLDKAELHVPIREDLEKVDTEMEVYLGVELNFTGYDQPFAFNSDIKERYGFQFAIGGIHSSYLEEYDLKKLIDIQHQHHLNTCQDPLVQVLVHPYWFGKGEFDRNDWPWFDSMKVVPESYTRELGQVAKETGTAIEINGSANLENSSYSEDYVREYVDYLTVLAEEGVVFAVGSDAHDINRLATVQTPWRVIDQLEIPVERVWRPEGKPMVGG